MNAKERDDKLIEIASKIENIKEAADNAKLAVAILRTVVMGDKPFNGLVTQVKNNTKAIIILKCTLAFIVGSGALTGAGFGIANLIN